MVAGYFEELGFEGAALGDGSGGDVHVEDGAEEAGDDGVFLGGVAGKVEGDQVVG